MPKLPTLALVVGWLTAMIGSGLLYGWGQTLLAYGIAAMVFAFFAWLWTS